MSAYLFLLALGLAAQGPVAHARAASLQREKLSCSTFPVDKNFGKKKLWDGYEVSVGPTAHFEDDSGADDACAAAIYDQSGKEVYRTTGPGVMLDPATGMGHRWGWRAGSRSNERRQRRQRRFLGDRGCFPETPAAPLV